ncbi:hypothetical protein LINGRAHAP2_LOCUS5376 [Linum grandiflorum]
MSSHHQTDLESAATDSVASSPRSDIHGDAPPRVRFMCSFGGKILPRPHDNLLRYVGGETRMVAVHRSTTFSALLTKLSKIAGFAAVTVKYQLPNEDLDALISVSTDEDVENMMDEYDRVALNHNPRSARLRLFLFPSGEPVSRAGSISSLLDGSTNREHWFFDALNSGRSLERGRSEASSIVSEMPDYLFGLENSDDAISHGREQKLRNKMMFNDSVSASDPGSPAPVISSPFCSTSSAAPSIPTVSSIPDLPPVKTRPETPQTPEPVVQRTISFSDPIETQPGQQQQQQQPRYAVQYVQEQQPQHYSGPAVPVQHIPVYYVPGPGPVQQQGNVSVQMQGNVPVQMQGNVPVQMRGQYVQQYSVPAGQMYHQQQQQVPGMGQMYGAMRSDPYEGARMVSDGMGQQQQPVYYGVRGGNAVMAGPGHHPGMVMSADELHKAGLDPKTGRVSGT